MLEMLGAVAVLFIPIVKAFFAAGPRPAESLEIDLQAEGVLLRVKWKRGAPPRR